MDRRYLLDTQVAVFFFSNRKELKRHIQDILEDYSNLFYVSTTTVKEIIHLCNSGRIRVNKWKTAADILPAIKGAYFELLPVKEVHLATYATLATPKGHNDPNDHIIISQAITERMVLISSDQKFEQYLNQDLLFIFNGR
ncbi:MAG: type II toxin-antitoxin system VapC family toxin [Prevotellaceae bacterium]|jgi:PIN domain nuclease of toxin-antitoxin system|nr:type II toxin-antitoxin system VapC family toxin [Prevotellaceae bacterium]